MKVKTLKRYERLCKQPDSPSAIRRRRLLYEKVMQKMHDHLRCYCAFAALSESNETEDALLRALSNLRAAADQSNGHKQPLPPQQ